MSQREALLPNKVGIALSIALLAFGLLTRNVAVVLLVVGSLLIRLPVPRLQRVLYMAIYFSVAIAGVLTYAAARDALNERVYFLVGGLAVFAVGGWAAYFYAKKHPEKNPDFRK